MENVIDSTEFVFKQEWKKKTLVYWFLFESNKVCKCINYASLFESFCTISYCLNCINVYWELEQRKFQQYSKRLAKLGYSLFFLI